FVRLFRRDVEEVIVAEPARAERGLLRLRDESGDAGHDVAPSCTAPGISWPGCALGLWAKKRVQPRAWQANCVAGGWRRRPLLGSYRCKSPSRHCREED